MPLKRAIAEGLWFLLRKCGCGPVLLRLHPRSGLLRAGWFRSFRQKEPIDRSGAAIPWWTYSFVDFIAERLSPELKVLEFGSGNSTIWLAQRVREIVSLESDESWAARVSARLPPNAQIVCTRDLVAAAKDQVVADEEYDVLVIDAGDRIAVASVAVEVLNDAGVVIWDNTDGSDWPLIRGLFHERGFRDLSFAGLTAQEVSASRTTLFYRDRNCLGV